MGIIRVPFSKGCDNEVMGIQLTKQSALKNLLLFLFVTDVTLAMFLSPIKHPTYLSTQTPRSLLEKSK